MYGVRVKTTGSGSFWPPGLKTVALSSTPSRNGILTPHSRSPGAASGSSARTAAGPAARTTKARTADRLRQRRKRRNRMVMTDLRKTGADHTEAAARADTAEHRV